MFKRVQNKLHFAVTGLSAPEIISHRVNPELPNLGLTSWSGARAFLDYAEDQARRLVVRGFFGEVLNKITLPELRVMADAMFRSMDADSDGALTRAELQRRGRRADGPRAQPVAPTPAQPAPR